MEVQFDAARGAFVVEPEGAVVDLDGRTGMAALELSGQRLAVRPLRWREKQRLARFARLPGDFVDGQLLRIVMEPPLVERELEPRRRDVMVSVARWLNGLDDGRTGLPLEPSLLVVATAEVCRALGLRPADLDDCEALEVEALWTEVRRAAPDQPREDAERLAFAPRPLPPGDGLTRVLIVPDPPSGAPPRPEVRGAEAVDAEPAPSAERALRGSTDATGPSPGGPRYRIVDPSAVLGATGRAPAGAPPVADVASGARRRHEPEPVEASVASGGARSTEMGTPAFGNRGFGSQVAASPPEGAGRVSAPEPVAIVPGGGRGPSAVGEPPSWSTPLPAGPSATTPAGVARERGPAAAPMPPPTVEAQAAPPNGGPTWIPRFERGGPVAAPGRMLFEPGAVEQDPIADALRRGAADALLEEFGERLERAATELGIGRR